MDASHGKSQQEASLLDVLIDGFEKNEIMNGLHMRTLPMPDEDSARSKFFAFADEATRWKGLPEKRDDGGSRRIVAWRDLEIRQVGRGVMVCVRAPHFLWWHEAVTWKGGLLLCDSSGGALRRE